MIKVDLNIPDSLIHLWDSIQEAINISLVRSTEKIRERAVQKAPYKSGTLRRSITTVVKRNIGIVWTNLKYAAIHEFGWKIKAKTPKWLRFKINGKWIRTKQVVIPKRPYLRPALEESVSDISRIFEQEFKLIIKK